MIDCTLLNLEPKQTKVGGSLNENEGGRRLFAVATPIPGTLSHPWGSTASHLPEESAEDKWIVGSLQS